MYPSTCCQVSWKYHLLHCIECHSKQEHNSGNIQNFLWLLANFLPCILLGILSSTCLKSTTGLFKTQNFVRVCEIFEKVTFFFKDTQHFQQYTIKFSISYRDIPLYLAEIYLYIQTSIEDQLECIVEHLPFHQRACSN